MTASRRIRWLAPAAAASLLVATVTGCGASPVTAARVERSVAATFANLWVLHEVDVGHPHPSAAALDASATCQKGAPTSPQSGAGNDWVCHVTWLVDGPQTPVTATYDLNVATDGCYAADGDGPASVNGSPTLADSGGGDRLNPLRAFNSCFDTT